jgi:hypothetical protein
MLTWLQCGHLRLYSKVVERLQREYGEWKLPGGLPVVRVIE